MRCIALAAVCAAALYAPVGIAAQDVPDATISLESLGYVPAPQHILMAEGYTVSSLHYVDAHHLLFTYNKRSLIKRMPDDSPDNVPQNVAAVLLETPSGKVVAHTEWRLPDHAQYLWPVGEGTFLLRIGRELRVLTPLAPTPLASTSDALQGHLLTTLPGTATMIAMAPDGRMLLAESDVSVHPATVDSAAPPASNATQSGIAQPGITKPDAQPAPTEDHTTDLQFLEFDLTRQAQGIVPVNLVGHIISPRMLALPLTHDGYMHATEIYPDDWDLIYTALNGKDVVLGDVVSTCTPGAAFLSNTEVLVETCNGNDTAVIMTVVTLGKKELWQQTLQDPGTNPDVRPTPASGRFALSRVLTDGVNSPGTDVLDTEDARRQRIDVMDIQNGALVASVIARPAQRTAQNFSLSPDGRHLAVLQSNSIALYDLAPMQDFPAARIKPKDLVFVAAPEGTAVPVKNAAATPAAAAPAAVAPSVMAPPAVIEVPLNVDARQAPPTLLTPEERKSVEGKKDKVITIQPIDPKTDPLLPPPPQKHQKNQDQQPQ
jgi:hypothetical protein